MKGAGVRLVGPQHGGVRILLQCKATVKLASCDVFASKSSTISERHSCFDLIIWEAKMLVYAMCRLNLETNSQVKNKVYPGSR